MIYKQINVITYHNPTLRILKMKKAFTLSEVLLTLTIVGIISALIIPSLLNDINQQKNINTWKSAYSLISSTTTIVKANNNGTLRDLIALNDGLKPEYIKYFNVKKDFGFNDYCTWSTCTIKRLNGSLEDGSQFDDGQFELSNGMFIFFQNNAAEPEHIWIDTNGVNYAPNTIGKDVFGILIYDDGIKPMGSQGDSYVNTCINSSTGWGCSANYLK